MDETRNRQIANKEKKERKSKHHMAKKRTYLLNETSPFWSYSLTEPRVKPPTK